MGALCGALDSSTVFRVAADVPDWKGRKTRQHGMKELHCQQTLVAGLHRAWLARAVAGLAVLSASDVNAQHSAKPSDAEICLAANESLSFGSVLPRTTVS